MPNKFSCLSWCSRTENQPDAAGHYWTNATSINRIAEFSDSFVVIARLVLQRTAESRQQNPSDWDDLHDGAACEILERFANDLRSSQIQPLGRRS